MEHRGGQLVLQSCDIRSHFADLSGNHYCPALAIRANLLPEDGIGAAAGAVGAAAGAVQASCR